MKSYHWLALLFVIGALLAACSDAVAISGPMQDPLPEIGLEMAPALEEPAIEPEEGFQAGEVLMAQVEDPFGDQDQSLWPDGEAQYDDQGAVEVAITPLNLNSADGYLNFNVGLNTHSVDLSMNLALLATLEADNGIAVQAVQWEAPRGGHHVSGVLSFPSISNSRTLLDGASRLTLRIHNVDVPERVFTWNLAG